MEEGNIFMVQKIQLNVEKKKTNINLNGEIKLIVREWSDKRKMPTILLISCQTIFFLVIYDIARRSLWWMKMLLPLSVFDFRSISKTLANNDKNGVKLNVEQLATKYFLYS